MNEMIKNNRSWIISFARHRKSRFFLQTMLLSQPPLLITRSKRHLISFSPTLFLLYIQEMSREGRHDDIEMDKKDKILCKN